MFYDRCEDWFGLSPSDAQELLAASRADAQAMSLAGAAQCANRVRSAIEALEVIGPSNETLKVTVSIGVASLDTDQQTTPAQLMAAADKALYEAKAAGRNRVRLAA